MKKNLLMTKLLFVLFLGVYSQKIAAQGCDVYCNDLALLFDEHQSSTNGCTEIRIPFYLYDYECVDGAAFNAYYLLIEGQIVFSQGFGSIVDIEANTNRPLENATWDGLNFTIESPDDISQKTYYTGYPSEPNFWLVIEGSSGATFDINAAVMDLQIVNVNPNCDTIEADGFIEDISFPVLNECEEPGLSIYLDEGPSINNTRLVEVIIADASNPLFEEVELQLSYTDVFGNLEMLDGSFDPISFPLSIKRNSIDLSSGPVVLATFFMRTTPDNPPTNGKAEFVFDYAWVKYASNSECCVPITTNEDIEVNPEYNFPCQGTDDFNISISEPEFRGCEAIYHVILNYTGMQTSGSMDFFDFDITLQVEGYSSGNFSVDYFGSPSTGHPGGFINCQYCSTTVNDYIVEFNTGGFKYFYQYSSIPIIDIIVTSNEVDACADGVTIVNVNWDPLGAEGNCVPLVSGTTEEACPNSGTIPLSGSVRAPCGRPIEGVDICFEEDGDCPQSCPPSNCDESVETDSNGEFESSTITVNCLSDEPIIATPCYDDCNWLCGVTTYDITVIDKHIQDVLPIVNPYFLIAADADNSGDIGNADKIALRKLILRLEDDIPGNTCLRFIDANYKFSDPTNPWAGSGFPENCIDVINGMADWVAVKTGDLNCNCGNPISTISTTSFNTTNQSKSATETVTIPIYASNFTDLVAYQVGIAFDPDYLEFVEFQEGDLDGITEEDNFGLTDVAAGKIRHLWFDEDGEEHSLETNEVVFNLVFTAKQAFSDLESIFSFDDEVLEGRTWDKSDAENDIELIIETGGKPVFSGKKTLKAQTQATGVISVDVVPNPFDHTTTFHISSPESGAGILEVFDALGAKIISQSLQLDRGQNTFTVKEFATLPQGVYTYRISAGEQSESGKLLKNK